MESQLEVPELMQAMVATDIKLLAKRKTVNLFLYKE